ncbi:uncharacterized protein LOC143033150 [Oratosquilla oratoria]|uniref:uncharacterized protein LOC143033150 n=1 Tax=Oratosquilla oratoria TaxID=337810 RepID=UPI003F76316F
MANNPPPADRQPLETKVSHITDVINTAATKSIPRTKAGQRPLDAWYSNDAMKVTKNEVNHCLKRLRRDPSQANRAQLSEANALHRRTCDEAMNEAWIKWTEELNDKTTDRDLWKRIKAVSGRNPAPPRHPDPAAKADDLCKTFAERSSSNNLPDNIRHHLQTLSGPRRRRAAAAIQEGHETDEPFTLQVFDRAASHKQDITPGDDEISFSMVARAPEILRSYILEVINHSWNEMRLPKTWKDANMAAVPKPAQDAFRSISLLSCINKIMETMVLNRINWAARPFHKNLLGFRQGVGTEDAIATVISQIFSVKNSGAKRKVTAVFLDLEKAFELSNRDAIIDAMVDAGLRGKLLGWCHDYLTDRRARVQFQGSYSSYQTFANGTPQDSSLSPTLFNFLVDQILRTTTLPRLTQMVAYADDLVIVSTYDSFRGCQKVLHCLQETTKDLGLKFSAPKTKAIHFSRTTPTANLCLNGQDIEWVNEYKYLGVIIDRHLSFTSHIKYVAKRVRCRLNAMRAISGLPGGANSYVLHRVYQTTIRPILEYGSVALAFASKIARHHLDAIQNRAARLILGVPSWSCTQTCLHETDLIPSQFRHDAGLTIFTDKVLRSPSHPLHSQVLSALEESKEAFKDNTWLLQTADNWRLHTPVDDYLPEIQDRAVQPPWVKPAAALRVNRPYDSKSSATHDQSFRATDGSSTVQTELAAIREAIIDSRSHPEDIIVIHTDSQGAIDSIRNPHRDNIALNRDIQDNIQQSGKTYVINWIPSHLGIPGNETADAAAKTGTRKPEPDVVIRVSRRQTKAQFRRTARTRWQNLIQDTQSESPQWNISLPSTREARTALNRLPRRTQCVINAIRVRAKTYRQIAQKSNICAYCDRDIRCQHVDDLTECPRTFSLRRRLLDYLPMEDHVGDTQLLAIYIVTSQTLRC